jgi:type III secretory pathway component EscV
MNKQSSIGRTRIVLSFSSAYAQFARRIANDLGAAKIDVWLDQWEGGGGVPGIQSVAVDLDDVTFVLPLLTPSNAAATWIGDEWKRAIHDAAVARGIKVLPVRGAGDQQAIPDFLSDRSHADLARDYSFELRRLVETIRDLSGDTRIKVPDSRSEANGAPRHPLALEVGEKLAPLFKVDEGTESFVDDLVPMMYEGLFYELGVQFPRLHLQVSSDLAPSSARIVINDVPETLFEVHPEAVMVSDTVAAMAELGIEAEAAINPATGSSSAWIPARHAESARNRGLTTWDPRGFLILTLSAVLRQKAADFIGIDQVEAMLKQIKEVFPHLVAETVPKTVSLFVLTDVLRRLIAEIVCIRNLRGILMALADWGRFERDPLMLTEYVRAALQRQITHQLSRGTRQLVVWLLDPCIEKLILDSMQHTPTGTYMDLEPARLRSILDSIRAPWNSLPDNVQIPQILTTMEIRSSVRRLVATSMPHLNVISYQELGPDADIQPLGRISLDGFSTR